MNGKTIFRIFTFILAAVACMFSAAVADTSELTLAGRWSVEKAEKWYAEQPWLVGCNFTPSTAINQLEMWQGDTFDLKTIDRELGWAKDIGMNTVRVYLHDLLWQQDREGFLKRIEQFLTVADKHNIKTMFVLCDSCWNPHPKLGKQPEPKPHTHNSGWVQSPHVDILNDEKKHASLQPYIKGVIGKFKDDKRVLVWDLYNEPANKNSEKLCLSLLKKIFTWARQINPSQPLTAGVWNGKWEGRKASKVNLFMLANSDVITFHSYNPIEGTKGRVKSLKPLGRPMLCTEYLSRARCTFQEHLPYFKKERIAAYNWGFVAGKIQTQYPWSSWKKKFTEEPEIWFHDILRPDGTPFDQREVDLIKSLTMKKKEIY